MRDNKENFINEAIALMKIIDETEITSDKDYQFHMNMKGKVKYPGTAFVSEKEIFWLRDIKDKQL